VHTVDHDALRRAAEAFRAEPRDQVRRAFDGGEVVGRRLTLDQLAQVREGRVEGGLAPMGVVERRRASLLGVARAPKWMYSSPVGRE